MPPFGCLERVERRHVEGEGRVAGRARERKSAKKTNLRSFFCRAVKEAGRQLGVGESAQPGKSER